MTDYNTQAQVLIDKFVQKEYNKSLLEGEKDKIRDVDRNLLVSAPKKLK